MFFISKLIIFICKFKYSLFEVMSLVNLMDYICGYLVKKSENLTDLLETGETIWFKEIKFRHFLHCAIRIGQSTVCLVPL